MQPLLPGSSRPAGVMVESIEQSLLNCSGFCNSFFRNVTANFTYIDMNSTEFGDRNSTCIKFPVTTPKMFSIGQYAPTVNTPGFALLRIASSEQVALKENETKFVGNIKQALAVFLIYFLLNCLVGTLFFTIVSHFSKICYFQLLFFSFFFFLISLFCFLNFFNIRTFI